MSPRPQLDMTLPEILALLREPHTGVLSTIGPGGFPHSVGIYYVVEEDPVELHMWVYAKSQKAVNVRRDPRSALLVEAGQPYEDLRGVLVQGRSRVTTEFDEVLDLGKKVYERYFAPRTGVALADALPGIERQSQKRASVIMTPTSFASWDHSRAG